MATTGKKTNRLINESSPYLIQHAYNPVDWYPWGDEALQKAKTENKVILVSIGYSACHWCHVMERESFEDETVAQLMNEHFVCIKIDREERPDIDHIYMDAVQAISGSGGWPLNVFLTPDKKPFYGGTYFPPVKAYQRSSWTDVLHAVKQAWTERRDEMIAQAENLTDHLQRSNSFGRSTNIAKQPSTDQKVLKEQLDLVFENIMKSADKAWGGFGKAPKFPQTQTIQFLLQYYHYTGNKEALGQALLSVDKMLQGGIYDHLGGGMARYSTDYEWLAPHFEKMLYDNALLINVLCDAFQVTKDPAYEKAIKQTIGFITNEFSNGQGGFFSALDADSEGEEGKYYVWRKTEVEEILGPDTEIFCDFFNISETGNWEGSNILRILKKPGDFAVENGLGIDEFDSKITACKQLLLLKRNERVKPQLDDKVLLGWNALMITALCKAGAALGESQYIALAEKCFQFLAGNMLKNKEGIEFLHTCKNGKAAYPAFLDDYAFLIQSCIYLQETTSNSNYLVWAQRLVDHVTSNFAEPRTGYFFFTGVDQEDVIVRKKEVHDGATPSGNSMMADNLFYLSIIFDRQDLHQIAVKALDALNDAIVNYPTSFATWATLIMRKLYGIKEIVIAGNEFEGGRDMLLRSYLPNKIVQCAAAENVLFPLLKGKNFNAGIAVYLCKNHECLAPVHSVEDLYVQLHIVENN